MRLSLEVTELNIELKCPKSNSSTFHRAALLEINTWVSDGTLQVRSRILPQLKCQGSPSAATGDNSSSTQQ